MQKELPDAASQKIRQLWFAWQANRPQHEALYLTFHDQIVRHHPELDDISLLQTLGALLPTESTRQGANPISRH